MEKPASTRQLKVAREIQKDLAEIIRSKGMSAMGGALDEDKLFGGLTNTVQARYEELPDVARRALIRQAAAK